MYPNLHLQEIRAHLERRNRDRTHYVGCWKDHPDCLSFHLLELLEEAREGLQRYGNALEEIAWPVDGRDTVSSLSHVARKAICSEQYL